MFRHAAAAARHAAGCWVQLRLDITFCLAFRFRAHRTLGTPYRSAHEKEITLRASDACSLRNIWHRAVSFPRTAARAYAIASVRRSVFICALAGARKKLAYQRLWARISTKNGIVLPGRKA